MNNEFDIDSLLLNNEVIPQEEPVKGSQKSDKPGRLKSEVTLCLNTTDSQAIFLGNHKGNMGLLQFGGRMTQIWNAAAQDDPYADLYLLRIYDGLIKLRNQLAALIQDYENQLSHSPMSQNLKWEPFASERPVTKELWFRTQYGYLGASLIGDFDRLVRIILTAKRVGIILNHSQDDVRQHWFTQIVFLFKISSKWEKTGIKRSDIKANNDLAKQVQEKMGKLPDAILTKKLRSPFSPFLKPDDEGEKTEVIN